MKKKLKLDPERLTVMSFEAAGTRAAQRGTVHGMSGGWNCPSRDGFCPDLTFDPAGEGSCYCPSESPTCFTCLDC